MTFSPFLIAMAQAFLYNFVDENTLSEFATQVSRWIKILEPESEVITGWFKKNKMVVNRAKSQAIILDKWKINHTNECIAVDN